MPDKPTILILDRIKALKGHDKSVAIEKYVKGVNSDSSKISILLYALADDDYSFCQYEGCVKSAAAYLYDLKDSLIRSEDRKAILNILFKNMANFDGISNTDDNLDRIKLLGVFKGEAAPALKSLKLILEEFDDDSEFLNEEWYQESFEFKCRSILLEAIDSIEN